MPTSLSCCSPWSTCAPSTQPQVRSIHIPSRTVCMLRACICDASAPCHQMTSVYTPLCVIATPECFFIHDLGHVAIHACNGLVVAPIPHALLGTKSSFSAPPSRVDTSCSCLSLSMIAILARVLHARTRMHRCDTVCSGYTDHKVS